MIKDSSSLDWTLLLVVALVFSLAVDGMAAGTKHKAKPSPSAKSRSKESPPLVRMTLEPKAMDVLKAASEQLAAARTMSFTAVVSYESPSRLGIPLIYTTRSEVTLQRPDKLRVITPGDGPASEFYYDGKRMIAFAPAENLIASADAPPTIDAALAVAYESAAIYFPFANMMAADPFTHISDGLVVAFYMGQSHEVGGTTTDMVVYANSNVLVQIWIGAEDKLPRKAYAFYRTDLAKRRHQVDFLDWQLDPAVPEDAFAPTGAESANPISFANPNPKALPYAKPPAKAKSSKKNGKK
jgi:hypothetical protein